ncbi:MAG: glucosamine-6-phosphate deaminase [Chthoniobacterales bacterium]
MKISISADKVTMGRQAAQLGIKRIKEAIQQNGEASIIVATGASQFEILEELVATKDIDWSVVTAFHLDEYVDLSIEHAASFRKYLRERFVEKLPSPLRAFHYVAGDTGDPEGECDRLGKLISERPIDVCFAGIGENAHLAFNDPPADFKTERPYLVVTLDADCRQQQFGEGWFPTIDDVPARAISMSIQQILKSRCIIISCPDERKAKAVQGSLEGPVTNLVPSSILQEHADTHVFLDEAAASLLAQSS